MNYLKIIYSKLSKWLLTLINLLCKILISF